MKSAIATISFILSTCITPAYAADSGIIKGPELAFGSIAKQQRKCKTVETVKRDGTIDKRLVCKAVK